MTTEDTTNEYAYKKRCLKCRYHWADLDSKNAKKTITMADHIFCGYMLVTGKRRPCPSNECTVFEPGSLERSTEW